MKKNKANELKPNSTRDMIYKALSANPGGLSGEELIVAVKRLGFKKTDIAISRSLLDLVQTSTLVYRKLLTNKATNRPCNYYFARQADEATALLEGPVQIEATVVSDPSEQGLLKLIADRRPVTEVMEAYHRVLETIVH